MGILSTALQRYFGFSSFRPGQAEAIQSLLDGRHTLTVMPTGAGKSLIYQLAALLLAERPGPASAALVVSPLIALMKDQVDALTQRGIPATFINSSLPAEEQSHRLKGLSQGIYRLVYVAPERLRSTSFLDALRSQPISLLAVDEAHCISEWGHDFRPDYLHIAQWRKTSPRSILTIALTATATPGVQKDIQRLLGLDEGVNCIVTGFNRPNLSLNVRYTSGPAPKLRALGELLSSHQPGAAIIYTGTRHDAEEVAAFASEGLGSPCEYYHAGLPAEERTRIQNAFIQGKIHRIAATNAFGMGIDRADVRQVIHFSLPGSLEAYYQEAGRAGRDGLPASATLLYDPHDRALQEFFIQQSELSATDLGLIHNSLPAGQEFWTTLDDLSNRNGYHPVQIKVGLSVLERAGVLDRLGDEGLRSLYRRGKWDASEIGKAIQYSQQHRQNRQKQLDHIVEYAESNLCRRKIVLRHFGDPDSRPIDDCCDNCRAAAFVRKSGDVAQMNPGERAALVILDCIRRSNFKVGKGKLAKILHGSKAQDILKFQHDKNVYYARLAAVQQADIEKLIDQLVDLGYIKAIGGELPVLSLTTQGTSAVQRKEIIPLKLPNSLAPEQVKRAQARLEAGGTVEYTAQLFAQGLTPQQIAAERSLSVATIYNHLAELIAQGRLSVQQVVEDRSREQIEAAIRKTGSTPSVGYLKSILPPEIDFGPIRCVLAGLPGAQAPAAPGDSVDAFLSKSHPRRLLGPWKVGWSLGFHSSISGSDWSRSQAGQLTYRLKYAGDASALPALVDQAQDLFRAQPGLGQVDFILPVPSSNRREVDPVQLFCEALGTKLNLPVHLLAEKTRPTRQQKEMKTLAQKRANVAGAFGLCAEVRHKRILVVDDLYDSGATLEEITRLLLRHGAACVNVFALTCTIHTDL